MAERTRDSAFDHVVAVMFENRSFDNLLGRLYQPGEVASFNGVTGKDLSNPIPEWAQDGADRGPVPYGVARDMNTPDPDPGEEYPHVNTQLFGLIDPRGNRGQPTAKLAPPYNAPRDSRQRPSMDGFVADYISAFTAETGRQPSYDEYAQIMSGYTPEQLPVISGLARGFATFDHWFCEVPSQTFTNRSFFHAGTASGYVVNTSPPEAFPVRNPAQTIFERLESRGLTWRVYCSPPSHVSFTGIIHAARLRSRFATNFFTTDQFLQDAAKGQLPAYSFIEPNLLHGHNDMHPGPASNAPSSLLGGEALLKTIYDAVRSSSARGSNVTNTLLLVNFDEHGGTYDHVPPPPACRPDRDAPAGQYGFTFDRSGVRVPAIAISAWVPERTVVSDEYRNTSVLATMRERWSLGAPLTSRDATARDMAPVLSLGRPRPPEDWPEVVARPVPAFDPARAPDAPMRPLSRAALVAVLALARQLGQNVPEVKQDEEISAAHGIAMVGDVFGHMFPRLHDHWPGRAEPGVGGSRLRGGAS